jgi:hypothetical protein
VFCALVAVGALGELCALGAAGALGAKICAFALGTVFCASLDGTLLRAIRAFGANLPRSGIHLLEASIDYDLVLLSHLVPWLMDKVADFEAVTIWKLRYMHLTVLCLGSWVLHFLPFQEVGTL